MSVGLLVVGSFACLLVMGLLGALAVLTRVERAHEERRGIRTEDRPRHAGKSGDLHLFLAVPAGASDTTRKALAEFGSKGEVAPERLPELVSAFQELLGHATHAHVEYGHFRRIRAQGVPGTELVYLNLRSRKPITEMLERGSQAEWRRTLADLSALVPADVVEAFVEVQKPSTDPADGRLVPLA